MSHHDALSCPILLLALNRSLWRCPRDISQDLFLIGQDRGAQKRADFMQRVVAQEEVERAQREHRAQPLPYTTDYPEVRLYSSMIGSAMEQRLS
jgi:hypothetical protein